MATLAENAAAVKSAAQAIDVAIVDKGGTTAGGLNNAAAAIAALPSGGTPTPLTITANGTYTAPEGVSYTPIVVDVTEYVPLPDAPNIREIVRDHTPSADYLFRGIFLFDIGTTSVSLSGGQALWCDEGGTISGTTVTWTDENAYHWVIIASNSYFTATVGGTNRANLKQIHGDASRVSVGKYGLCALSGLRQTSIRSVTGSIDFSGVSDLSGIFYSCTSLEQLPDVLDVSSSTSFSQCFYSCVSLKKAPLVLDVSAAVYFSSMFINCESLTRVPDVFDLSSAIGVNGMFSGCSAILALPTHLTFPDYADNITLDLSYSKNVSSDSWCEFAADGETIVGGMVANLNDVKTRYDGFYTRTIQLPNTLKNYFTSAQRQIINDRLNALGYTITNFAP